MFLHSTGRAHKLYAITKLPSDTWAHMLTVCMAGHQPPTKLYTLFSFRGKNPVLGSFPTACIWPGKLAEHGGTASCMPRVLLPMAAPPVVVVVCAAWWRNTWRQILVCSALFGRAVRAVCCIKHVRADTFARGLRVSVCVCTMPSTMRIPGGVHIGDTITKTPQNARTYRKLVCVVSNINSRDDHAQNA